MQERLNVFNFSDYRSFLRAYAQEEKSKNPAWSFGMWSKRLKLASTSAITMIINGDRHPSSEVANRLCDYFRFNEKERRFFLDLVRLKKIKNDPELSYLILKNLTKCHPQKKFSTLTAETFETISNWQHYAIREMISLPGFKENSDWIKERLSFPLNKKQIEMALVDLETQKLVERDSHGRLKVTKNQISTTNDVAQEAVVQFHEQVADLAKLAVRQFDLDEREFGALTLNIRKKDMKAIKEFIRKFQDEFMDRFEVSSGDETYQMNLGFFPLTREETEDEKKSND